MGWCIFVESLRLIFASHLQNIKSDHGQVREFFTAIGLSGYFCALITLLGRSSSILEFVAANAGGIIVVSSSIGGGVEPEPSRSPSIPGSKASFYMPLNTQLFLFRCNATIRFVLRFLRVLKRQRQYVEGLDILDPPPTPAYRYEAPS